MGFRAALVRLRSDARRPASWVGLAGAAGATWLAAGFGGAWPPVAIVGGAAAAVAALGVLPRLDALAARAASRAAWPAAGSAGAWLALGGGWTALGAAGAVLAACVATTAAVVGATRAGFTPAAVSGAGLASAVAAGVAAAAAMRQPATATAWPLGAAVAWGLVAAACGPLRRGMATAAATGRSVGPLGGAVPRVAMVTALLTMVPCLFLAPHLAWVYAAVAVGWMLVVVLPRATLGPGPDGDAARRVLTATVGPRARPGRASARLVAAYAAVFAWPPLVASVLDGSTGATEPVTIAVALMVGSGMLAGLAAMALAVGWSRETTHACALVAATVALAAAAGRVAGPAYPAIPARGLMLSNPDDPATLP